MQRLAIYTDDIISQKVPSKIPDYSVIQAVVILNAAGDALQASLAQLQQALGQSETIINLIVTGTAEFQTTSLFTGVSTFTLPSIFSNSTGIVAAGTNQATATPLTAQFNNVITCSVNTKGVKLPTAIAGQLCVVKNISANDLLLYPFLGDAIDLVAVNTAITLYIGQELWLWAIDATTWQTSANVSLFGTQTIAGTKTFSSPVIVSAGAVGAPGIAIGTHSSGFYEVSATQLGFEIAGVLKGGIDANGLFTSQISEQVANVGITLGGAAILRQGTATAGTEPLLFTSSGSGIIGLNTVAVKGAVEFSDYGLWFTPGATRHKIWEGLTTGGAPVSASVVLSTTVYGANTGLLGTPDKWITVTGEDGVLYSIPAYIPSA